MRRRVRGKAAVALGVAALVVATYVAAGAATGFHFGRHDHPPPGPPTRSLAITVSGGSGPVAANLNFTDLLPGVPQTLTVSYRNSGNTTEDVYVLFPNATALSAFNTLGNYGAVQLVSSGPGALGAVFASTNLDDSTGTCGTFSTGGCWPLRAQYLLTRALAPGSSDTLSFRFTFASAYSHQADAGATNYWNPYPVTGQSTVRPSDGAGAGLPYELAVTAPGATPGPGHPLLQVAPLGATVTVPSSGNGFHDQLNVHGASGAVTYVVTSADGHLHVSSDGSVTTVDGPLSVGQYSVAGTVVDGAGDTGTWRYTLNVTKVTIFCNGQASHRVARSDSGHSFHDYVVVNGASGAVSFVESPGSSSPHLRVSSSGEVTTVNGPLSPGSYAASGSDSDGHGDSGTWSYTLTVTS